MRNITISMDDDLARRTRVAAAHAGKSVSKYMAEAAREKLAVGIEPGSDRNLQLEAVERFLDGPQLNISKDGRMPAADERNAREWQRDIR
jgi:plasmid stability protein